MEKNLNVADYKCSALINIAPGTPIVFLHGFSYSSEIWQQIGVTELLAEKHIPFLALDMPYGMRSKCSPKTRSQQKNLEVVSNAVKEVFNSQPVVLVGASFGGNLALQFATRFPVKGLVLIAPGRALELDLVERYRQFKFPTTIIWGSEDNIVTGENMRTLAAKLPKAKLIIYEGARHSAYKDQPDRFKKDLLKLYAKSE